MVRLMLVLAPVMCILSGIAVSSALGAQVKYLDAPKNSQTSTDKKSKKAEASTMFRSEVAWTFTVLMSLFLVKSISYYFCLNSNCKSCCERERRSPNSMTSYGDKSEFERKNGAL